MDTVCETAGSEASKIELAGRWVVTQSLGVAGAGSGEADGAASTLKFAPFLAGSPEVVFLPCMFPTSKDVR